ncbi:MULTISPECIES: sulfur carrier protein ThiS [unclassified Dokdonia]|jgi:sulfur carrier protein|uniref:sulfur carrier protein ThiS n=1 Tax=unclassified Dokdonia TaxID=2615033 RepID=UPI00020A66B5|nr:sulfur carrier protein ThiS [Dokdonia sp. 4H-3-7-5]AEE20631.1 thiamine biosynthesis protein ThiS [Dokdonia sp. 4H-3-7-5]|tara:strand:- start:16890 stop:17093 length:204 start_codon:yes stop_codon:yes gene_type:complete
MINIKVNQTSYQFPAQVTLDQILTQLDISVSGIAVAINERIITRSHWVSTIPDDGDAVLIIKATQGG